MSTVMSPSGLDKPQTGDNASTWWDDLLALFQFVNDLKGKNITKDTATIIAANWGSKSNGEYSYTVTMPSGYTFDGSVIKFRETTTGEVVYPKVTRLSSTTFSVTVNDNTIGLTITYV